jgi:hypothetical protein
MYLSTRTARSRRAMAQRTFAKYLPTMASMSTICWLDLDCAKWRCQASRNYASLNKLIRACA